jgi:hypothetical protein
MVFSYSSISRFRKDPLQDIIIAGSNMSTNTFFADFINLLGLLVLSSALFGIYTSACGLYQFGSEIGIDRKNGQFESLVRKLADSLVLLAFSALTFYLFLAFKE